MFRSIFQRRQPKWAVTVAATGWSESTFAELAWDRSRGAAARWAVAGVLVGALLALLVFAPAAWLASAISTATGERISLTDARGTVWAGSAVLALTGGPGSRDASALPGRLNWTLGLRTTGLALEATQACCLNGVVTVLLKPGLGRMSATLLPTSAGWVGQWPSAWLGGLGTPWNTLQLGGSAKLVSPGMTVEAVQGRWRIEGQAQIDLTDVTSRLSTLPSLGSYRFTVSGDAANAGTAQLNLVTLQGALQLSGVGTSGAGKTRFRGEARAQAADEPALSNLLNIIGRRDGARSVISIG
ncbi:MAG: type II secretion system protein N [Pseudorhodobacter sp.]|nr:type II secretion system protein N [Rhizobacter sp.]